MPFDLLYGKQGGQYAFYRIPKLLFTDSRFDTLSTDAKLLYGMLIDRMELSLKTGGLMNRAHIPLFHDWRDTGAFPLCGRQSGQTACGA